MKEIKQITKKALSMLIVFTVLCGIAYTGVITGAAQLIFPHQSNGSIIEVNGVRYGSELLGQQYNDERHM